MGVSVLGRPLYSVSEAARLLEIPGQKLRRWLDGFTTRGQFYPPVIRPQQTGSDEVSWAEFVEAGFLREYRVRQVSLQKLRPVVEEMRRAFGVPYPLAHFKPLVDHSKQELVLGFQEETGLDAELYLVRRGRNSWQVMWAEPVRAFLEKVEFDPEGVAERMRPLGKDSPVVIDPNVSFGVPQVGGIRTEILAEAYAVGEQLLALAKRYNLTVPDVEAALRWELRLAKVS